MTTKALKARGIGKDLIRRKLAEALREEKLPRVCRLHFREVWYDEGSCPACCAIREWLALTDKEAKDLAR